jgi:hypothetical protein
LVVFTHSLSYHATGISGIDVISHSTDFCIFQILSETKSFHHHIFTAIDIIIYTKTTTITDNTKSKNHFHICISENLNKLLLIVVVYVVFQSLICVLSCVLLIVTPQISIESFTLLETGSISTHFINAANSIANQMKKTIIVGLNTLTKNDLKLICFVKTPKNHFQLPHESLIIHDFSIQNNRTAIGDKTINIHKYIILINARIQKTHISIEYTIVVHHCIIKFKIVFLIQFSLESSTLLTIVASNILNHK